MYSRPARSADAAGPFLPRSLTACAKTAPCRNSLTRCAAATTAAAAATEPPLSDRAEPPFTGYANAPSAQNGRGVFRAQNGLPYSAGIGADNRKQRAAGDTRRLAYRKNYYKTLLYARISAGIIEKRHDGLCIFDRAAFHRFSIFSGIICRIV